VDSQPVLSPAVDPGRTIRTIKTRIIPFILLLYVIAVLDRTNIGFAALTMNSALAITSRQFGFLAGIFFVGYFFFEVPSNLLLHRLGARIWLARIMVSWGVLATLGGLVHSAGQLYVLRFLLGVAEAGFYPGIILYFTYWFPRRERAQAVALFMIGMPLTSVLGAPLSGFILDHVHWLGFSSWRWLLILEGIPAVLAGLLTYFRLPSRPAEAGFLSPGEKQWIAAELAQEEPESQGKRRISALQVVAHGRVWLLTVIYFAFLTGWYSISFWMPLAVKALSARYSNTLVGILVMVPHLVGLLGMVFVSRHSDRTQERRYHTALPAIAAGIALLLQGATSSPFWSIVALSVATLGIYSFFGPFWSLPTEFLTGFSAAAGIAFINSFANLGGFVGPYAIGGITEMTGSVSHALAIVGLSFFVAAVLILLLPLESRPRAQTERQPPS